MILALATKVPYVGPVIAGVGIILKVREIAENAIPQKLSAGDS